MLLRFLKPPLPIVLLFILTLAILLWLKTFLSVGETVALFEQYPMPFYGFIVDLTQGNLLWRRIIAFAIVIVCALYLLQFCTNHQLISERTYLPALLFILVGASLEELQRLNPALLALPFLIMALDYLLKSSGTRKPFDFFFRSAFWIGIATLIYLPSFLYFVLVVVAMVLYGSMRFRIFLSSLFGILSPWVLFLMIRYFLGTPIADNFSNIIHIWSIDRPIPFEMQTHNYVMLSFNILLIIIAVLFLTRSLIVRKIKVRRSYGFLLWFIIITVGIFLLTPSVSIELVYFAAFPIAILYGNYFSMSRNRFWPQFFLLCLLALSFTTALL